MCAMLFLESDFRRVSKLRQVLVPRVSPHQLGHLGREKAFRVVGTDPRWAPVRGGLDYLKVVLSCLIYLTDINAL
jgi:hypothetical protein